MASYVSVGYAGVMQLASDLTGSERDFWLNVINACYELTGMSGYEKFAKRWLGETFGDGFFSLRKLKRYQILEQAGESVRGGHRAYWRMPDREGVRRALEELGYLQGSALSNMGT